MRKRNKLKRATINGASKSSKMMDCLAGKRKAVYVNPTWDSKTRQGPHGTGNGQFNSIMCNASSMFSKVSTNKRLSGNWLLVK